MNATDATLKDQQMQMEAKGYVLSKDELPAGVQGQTVVSVQSCDHTQGEHADAKKSNHILIRFNSAPRLLCLHLVAGFGTAESALLMKYSHFHIKYERPHE